MKLLRLIRSRLRQYWVTNRLILCLFLVGGVLSSVAFAFFYGNMNRYLSYRTSMDTTYRTYEVRLSNEWWSGMTKPETAIFADQVEALYASEAIESVKVSWFFIYEESVEYDIPRGNFGMDAFSRIEARPGDQWEPVALVGSADFEEYPDGAVIPEESVAQIGDTFTIDGKTLTVIGKCALADCIVSYETFLELAKSIDTMTILTKERYPVINDPMEKMLQEMYPDLIVDSPGHWAEYYEKRAMEVLFLGIGPVYAVSITSFLFLLRYLMDAMLRSTVICRMVGAGKRNIFALCLGEAAVMCAVTDAIGIGIHWLLYDEVFQKLNSAEDLTYLPEDYLAIFLIMLGLGMAVVALFVRKYARLSPVASRRMAE